MDRARVASNAFFAELPDEELDVVAASADEVEFAEGQAITREGDLGHCLYVVESGAANVLADGEVIGAVGPGDVVGEIAVLASGRRTASVVAATSRCARSRGSSATCGRSRQTAPEAARRLRAALDGQRE